MKQFNDACTSTSVGYQSSAGVWTQANKVGNTAAAYDTTYSTPGIKAYPGGPTITTDNLHPNDWGHYLYATEIAKTLLSGESANSSSVSSGSSGLGGRSNQNQLAY